jgi:hypothetical protein
MSYYEVVVTRDTTESTIIEVFADSVEEAHIAAINRAKELDLTCWDRDEMATSEEYITGCDKMALTCDRCDATLPSDAGLSLFVCPYGWGCASESQSGQE